MGKTAVLAITKNGVKIVQELKQIFPDWSVFAPSKFSSENIIQEIKKANTARHVSEIIQKNQVKGFFDLICGETYKHMRKHSEEKVPIDVILFDFEGNILARKSEQ